MIRRISKHNDLRDLIKSCPSGVIDDIYAIEYYIQGHNDYIQGDFTQKGGLLEVILPSTDLETLPNGILMRKSYYRVLDSSYPDGFYNLEFDDNLNVWLGDEESEEPINPEYVTEAELASVLVDYATQEWVDEQGYITSADLSNYATEAWVEGQGYVTEAWVEGQGFLVDPNIGPDDHIVTFIQPTDRDPIIPNNYVIGNYLEGNYVEGTYIGQNGAGKYYYNFRTWEETQDPFVTETDLRLAGYATQDWADHRFVENNDFITTLSSYATQDWVGQQGYITSAALSGYATETWVGQQGFASDTDLSSLEARVSALEVNYGDAITITNNILS